MTLDIVLVLTILLLAVILFISERIRVDLVGLLVLAALALSGLLSPTEALSGFSNPAVVTVWAMFILSGALARTGIAQMVGRQVLRVSGSAEGRLIAVIMLTGGVLSAFMNNVGVAALMLPVIMDIARRTSHPPSRLLMPLAFGCLLGGLTTLIGTPPNILISDALSEANLTPFQLFDFAPVGVAIMVAGVVYMSLVGRRLLPRRDITREMSGQNRGEPGVLFEIDQDWMVIEIQASSKLAQKTLTESHLGSAVGLNVVAIWRRSVLLRFPTPETRLEIGDRLLVEGKLDLLSDLKAWQPLAPNESGLATERLYSSKVAVAEVRLYSRSTFVGQTIFQADVRGRFGVHVLAIDRDGEILIDDLPNIPLKSNDQLLIHGEIKSLKSLEGSMDFERFQFVSHQVLVERYPLQRRLLALKIHPESILVGQTLEQSRLGEALNLIVLAITRGEITELVQSPAEQLQAGDTLLVQGNPKDLETLEGLQALQVEKPGPDEIADLESGRIQLMEVILSPHTTLADKSLRQLRFRDRFGLNVLGIWRGGRAYRAHLKDMTLRFGDALLLYGPRNRLDLMANEPDFLVLTESAQETPRREKAGHAIFIMMAVLIPVIAGWLPISIAAVTGAALMVLFGCLTMEEAYRQIDWQGVFLIAGMLPLGIAMERTGAATLLAEQVVLLVGPSGGLVTIAVLFLMAALISQVMPNAAVAVLLAPLALGLAADLHISPHSLMMTVAIAASASFLSPVSHPANLMVLGPGGYRFGDYIRVGIPLTLTTLVVLLAVLPIFWPL